MINKVFLLVQQEPKVLANGAHSEAENDRGVEVLKE